MANLRRYQHGLDYNQFCEWMQSHRALVPPEDSLPHIGFVVDGIAMGFVYMTDSSVAIIENMVTNPKSSLRDRYDAVDDITDRLEEAALELKYKQLIVITDKHSITEKALNRNYLNTGEFSLLVKELTWAV